MAKMLYGADRVLKNLNLRIKQIENGAMSGLIRGGLLVKRRSMEDTPVEYANLKNSHFVTWKRGPMDQASFKGPQAGELERNHMPVIIQEQAELKKLQVAIGCTAFYSVYVHENLEARHTVGHAKFLENALKRSESNILKEIENGAKIR